MKILFIVPGSPEKGAMQFIKRQIDSIEKGGVTVKKIFIGTDKSLSSILSKIILARKTSNIFCPDIVHAQFGTLTSFVAFFCSSKYKITTIRGGDVYFVRGINFFTNFLRICFTYISVLNASHVICVSKKLREKLWIVNRKTSIIPNGVDICLFRPIEKEKACNVLGLDVSKSYVLFNAGTTFISSIVKQMNFAEDIFAELENKNINIRPIILKGEVPHEKIYLYYNAVDCLLVVSEREGSPNVIKEALACNLPIVSLDVGDVKERLASVSQSFVVKKDIKLIVDKIIEIIESGFRSNGRESIIKLTEEKVAYDIIQIYNRITKKNENMANPAGRTVADRRI